MKVLFVLSSLLLVASSANLGRLCGCPPEYSPVCASNYETYPNECEMLCDPLYPNLFKLYNGPCIMADSSAEARDQYATRQGLQFNNQDLLKATAIARETEDNPNTYYGSIINLIRLRHGKDSVISLKDRLVPKLRILLEIESRNAGIKHPLDEMLQGEVSRYGDKQLEYHQNNHSSEIINLNIKSDSKTSNQFDHHQPQNMYHQNLTNDENNDAQSEKGYNSLGDYDDEVNSHALNGIFARQAEDEALQVEIDAQKVYDKAGRTKIKVLEAHADANKTHEEALQAEEQAHTLNSDEKEDIQTRLLQIEAQAHNVENNAHNAIKEARMIQAEARQVQEKARQAAKHASEVETLLESRQSSQPIKQENKAIKIAQKAQKKAHRAENKARKAEARARHVVKQAFRIEHQTYLTQSYILNNDQSGRSN